MITKTTNRRSDWQTLLVTMLMVTSLVLMAWGIGRAEPVSPRQDRLEKALTLMWLHGFDATVRQSLEQLAGEATDEVTVKALFHLGCGALLEGKRGEAVTILGRIEKLGNAPEAKATAETFHKLLFPLANATGTVSIDVQNMAMPEVIRTIARSAGRSVIIDENVQPRKLTLHLPDSQFDEVMKILCRLGDLDTEQAGDIVVVHPGKPASSVMVGSDVISLDLNDYDIHEVLRFLASRAKMNVVFHKSVGGRISVKLDKVKPDEAFRLVTRSNDLIAVKEGDAWLVMNADQANAMGGKPNTMVVQFRNLDPDDAVVALTAAGFHNVARASETRGVVLTGSAEEIDKARALLRDRDQPSKPVMIATKIWEFKAPGPVDPQEFAKLSQAEKEKLAKLIAAPRILTLLGRSATVTIGDKKKGDEKIQNGVELSFYPSLLPNGMIQMQLSGTINTEVVQDQKAMESTRKIDSIFVIKPGSSFAYEVQGGAVPTLIEIMVTEPESHPE
jgi:hypothetical protein